MSITIIIEGVAAVLCMPRWLEERIQRLVARMATYIARLRETIARETLLDRLRRTKLASLALALFRRPENKPRITRPLRLAPLAMACLSVMLAIVPTGCASGSGGDLTSGLTGVARFVAEHSPTSIEGKNGCAGLRFEEEVIVFEIHPKCAEQATSPTPAKPPEAPAPSPPPAIEPTSSNTSKEPPRAQAQIHRPPARLWRAPEPCHQAAPVPAVRGLWLYRQTVFV